MLVEIKGKHGSDVVMFGDVAKQLFKMMDLSGNLEGALKSEDLPAALTSLEAALSNHVDPPQQEDGDDTHIGMKTRALPLIELIRKNIDAGGYIMWQKQ